MDLAKKNCHYVKYRLDIQGVSPPLSSSFSGPRPRTESDFDAGCKYHVAAGAPYARYFAAFILQFQIYRALCQGDDVQRPMHQCTFFGKSRNKPPHLWGKCQNWTFPPSNTRTKPHGGKVEASAGAWGFQTMERGSSGEKLFRHIWEERFSIIWK